MIKPSLDTENIVGVKSVFKGMATLALGAGVARVVGVLSIPLLTRIYSPEDFGVLSVFAALVAQLVPFLTLRYGVALPLPTTNRIAMNLLVLNVMLVGVGTVVVTIILAVFAPTLLGWLSSEALLPYWWLIPTGAAVVTLYELLSFWATRIRAYKVIARTQFIQSVSGESMKIVLGLVGLQPLGLVLGQITAQGGGSGTFLLHFAKQFQSLCRAVRYRHIIFVARKYRDFPIFRLPSQVLLVLSSQFPIFFTAALFGTGIAGQLGLATSMLSLPMSLIGQSMSRAFYGEAVLLRKKPKRLWEVTFSVQKRLFLFAIPIALGLMLSAEWVFSYIFGAQWVMAGRFVQIMGLYLAFQMTSAPLMQVLNILERQRSFLVLNTIRVVGLVCIYFWGREYEVSALDFIFAISVFLSLFYVSLSVYALGMVRRAGR